MPDPTESVLVATFCTTFGLFAITAGVRKMMRKPGLAELAPAESPLMVAEEILEIPRGSDDSPYQPPSSGASPLPMPPPMPVGRVPVWFYRPLDLVGLAAIFTLFFVLVIGSVSSQGGPAEEIHPAGLIASIILQVILAVTAIGFVIRRVCPIEWLGLRWAGWKWVFLIAPVTVVSMWVVFGALQAFGFMRWIESFGVETVQDTVKILQASKNPQLLALMTVAAVIVAPICEEIVFRGYLYGAGKRFAGPWVAGICSALVFSAAHGSVAMLLPLFIFGGVLAFVYERTGSLWAPCAVHFCFNGATVVIQMAARYYEIPLDTGT